MDNLARDSKKAKHAGMSYGQWKALNPETKPVPKVRKTCNLCGEPIPALSRNIKYCSKACAATAHQLHTSEFNKKRARAIKNGEI